MKHDNPAITDDAFCVIAPRVRDGNLMDGGIAVVGPFESVSDAAVWGHRNIAETEHDNPHWVVSKMTRVAA